MTVLYLVRHAKPAATWGEATDSKLDDPGLDELGRAQAQTTADTLRKLLPALPVYTSPLQRCRETAAPLASHWRCEPIVSPQVAEIPSPPLKAQAKRIWLTKGMEGTWPQLQTDSPMGSPDYLAWRMSLLDSLFELTTDSVIFSHFIAINVAVGAAQGHDRVISFRPGHASVTEIEIFGKHIAIRKLGAELNGNDILLGK